MFTKNCENRFPTIKNSGIRAQANMTVACGQEWTRHDGVPYYAGSDVEAMGYHISVKARHFSLMSSTLCEGETTMEGIWSVYERNVHSDLFVYIIGETAYCMTLTEFKEFVFTFCQVERDGGNSDRQKVHGYKIRARRCESKMLAWFEARL